MNEVETYLSQLGIALRDTQELSTGASGAKVVTTGDAVIKIVDCKQIKDPSLYKMAVREYVFYKSAQSIKFTHLPEVLFMDDFNDCFILGLKRYKPLTIGEWNTEYQLMAADLCAQIHAIPKENTVSLKLNEREERFTEQNIRTAQEGWESVLLQLESADRK